MCTASVISLLAAASVFFSAIHSSVASPVVTIPLDKQYVPVVRNNHTVSYKTAFFGRIFLGFPKQQNFTVIFDTGSGHLFLPSSRCSTETCRKHNRYNRSLTSSAVDLDHRGDTVFLNATQRDQVHIAYGTGEVTGEFVRETLCLTDHSSPNSPSEDVAAIVRAGDSPACVRMRVITATELTEEPFRTFDFDGVLGLGLDSLAVHPEFSLFGQMVKQNKLPHDRFAYFVSRNDAVASEISIGGHNPARMASDFQWIPVHKPELGFWQMQVKSVSVAGESVPLCEQGECVAIADTGTSLIGAPRQATQRLHWLLARKVPDNPSEIDCTGFPGPDLVFEMANGVNITVGPEFYSRATAMRVLQTKTNASQVICRASLLPIDDHEDSVGSNVWILGEPVLRKYYTAYDWAEQRIGFAIAQQPRDQDVHATMQSHSVYGAPPTAPPTPTMVSV